MLHLTKRICVTIMHHIEAAVHVHPNGGRLSPRFGVLLEFGRQEAREGPRLISPSVELVSSVCRSQILRQRYAYHDCDDNNRHQHIFPL
eukprot:676038-Prorocentrum_minimum.AAC.2